MEKLKKKHDSLVVALKSFEKVINYRDTALKDMDLTTDAGHELFCMVRDSVIQRFEYSYELSWTYLALYMQSKQGVQLELHTPAYIFREACQSQLISAIEIEQALEMIQVRNKTSHIYKEEIADYVAKRAKEYCALMLGWAERFKAAS